VSPFFNSTSIGWFFAVWSTERGSIFFGKVLFYRCQVYGWGV
jgi:hypothetical protein